MSNPMAGGGMGGWTMLRSIRSRDEVRSHQLSRGATRRIVAFAQPYRRDIVVFLITVVLSAVIGVATPVLAGDVINTITKGGGEAGGIVVRLALFIAGLAVVDALLSLAQRLVYSARIGEGIILRPAHPGLRARAADVDAFFTRTQTGELVSRLNSDVTGAQRRSPRSSPV